MKRKILISEVFLMGMITLTGCGSFASSSASLTSSDNVSESTTSSESGNNIVNIGNEKYEFVNLYKNDEAMTIAAKEEKTIELKQTIEKRRYFKIDILTNVDLLGTISYREKETSSSLLSENFFIPAGSDMQDFRQFLDIGRPPVTNINERNNPDAAKIGQARKAKWVESVSFKNVSASEGSVTVFDIESTERTINTTSLVTISDDYYKLGVSLSYGGALTYLEKLPEAGKNVELVVKEDGYPYVGIDASNTIANSSFVSSSVNLIDDHDTGRLVQQSYYGTNDGYDDIKYSSTSWCYNPVQGGDQGNYRSQIIDYYVSDTEIYVKTRAMDWAQYGYTTPSYMINKFTLSDGNIRVYNSFTDWSGLDHGKVRDQEVPAFYTHYAFNHFATYRGSSPWTGSSNIYKKTGLDFWGNGQQDRYRDCTENWVAWTNENDWGLGIYVPEVSDMLNGSYKYSKYESVDDATNYTAPIVRLKLKTYKTLEYSYAMTVGSLTEIRGHFTELHDGNSMVNNFEDYQNA